MRGNSERITDKRHAKGLKESLSVESKKTAPLGKSEQEFQRNPKGAQKGRGRETSTEAERLLQRGKGNCGG